MKYFDPLEKSSEILEIFRSTLEISQNPDTPITQKNLTARKDKLHATRDLTNMRVIVFIAFRLLASGAIVWIKEHGSVNSVLTADRV